MNEAEKKTDRCEGTYIGNWLYFLISLLELDESLRDEHIETVISCWTWFKLDDILNCCASDFWYNIDTLLTCCHTVVLFENLTLIYPLDKHESQARDRVEKDVYLGPQTCVYLKNDLVVLPLHIKILTSMYDMRRFKSSASCSVTMWPS